METKGTTGEETISYWFELPIDVAEFEEKLGIGAESGDYRIIEKVLPYADEVHEHTSVYQLNELDFMYRQLSSDMQEEYVSLLTVFENLEALYICRNVITIYPDCKSIENPLHQLWCEGFLCRHAFKRSCRWQVLCVKKCTKVFGCGSIMIKKNRYCFNMSWMRKANKS